MGPTFDFNDLIIQLGREFHRRGMKGHLQSLRRLWLARRARPRPGAQEWTEDFALEWLVLLRIPPLDRVLAVLPASSACPRCGGGKVAGVSHAHVKRTWPGGWLIECADCGAAWLCDEERR
jgi:hypothetical protein